MKKKISTLIMALAMVSAIAATTGMEAKAATASWSLRYVQHAESSANKTTWAKYVNTTTTTTTMKISKVGGGAQVYAYTSNGISMISSGTATSYVPTVKNKSIYVYAGYLSYGTSNSYPSGSVTY